MAFRLPPLNALRLFEAAGRLLSFKLAAQELHITPSAVSHGIQGLEGWLGVPLFVRSARGLSLTEAGASYLPQVRDALTRLASASNTVAGRASAYHITISVTPTFGARLLLPKLDGFQRRHPGATVHIDTTHHQIDLRSGSADLAIRMGTGQWQGLEAVHLLDEDLVPVCTPAIKERHDGLAAIGAVPLIHVTTVAHDWDTWLRAVGQVLGPSTTDLRVDTIQMAFDAAIRGMGIVMGRRPLVDLELDTGMLVPLVERSVRSPTAYWLVGLRETMRRSDIEAFTTWLLAELSSLRSSVDQVTSPRHTV